MAARWNRKKAIGLGKCHYISLNIDCIHTTGVIELLRSSSPRAAVLLLEIIQPLVYAPQMDPARMVQLIPGWLLFLPDRLHAWQMRTAQRRKNA